MRNEKRERKMLKFINQYIEQNGSSPTVQDVCDGASLTSLRTGLMYLLSLEDKGYIQRKSNGVKMEIIILNKHYSSSACKN